MDARILKLYDEYTHVPLPRRVFIERLAGLCGSTAAAMALLPLLDNNYANAAIVPADDPRVATSRSTTTPARRVTTGPLRSSRGRGPSRS